MPGGVIEGSRGELDLFIGWLELAREDFSQRGQRIRRARLMRSITAAGFRRAATVRSRNDVSLEPQRSFAVGEMGPDTDWRIPLDGVDVVAHLAARAHFTQKRSNSLEAYRRVNVGGTEASLAWPRRKE